MAAFSQKTLKQSPVSVFVRRGTVRVGELSGSGNCPGRGTVRVGELSGSGNCPGRGTVRVGELSGSGNCPGRGTVRVGELSGSGNCPGRGIARVGELPGLGVLGWGVGLGWMVNQKIEGHIILEEVQVQFSILPISPPPLD